MICTLCCGQHRGREIQCPQDCSHLGRGAGDRPVVSVLDRATGKMLDHMTQEMDWCEAAVDAYVGGMRQRADIETYEQVNLAAYMAYGYTDDRGDRYVDRYLRQHGPRLRPDLVEALEGLKTAWCSLFEVQQVRRDEGLQLLDLMTGEPLFVHEKTATREAVRLDLLLVWVAKIDGRHVLTGDGCKVPRLVRPQVQEAMRGALATARAMYPDAPDRSLLARTAGAGHHALAMESKRPWGINYTTTDGEDVVFCEAVFDMFDEEEMLAARLEEHEDVEVDVANHRHVWLDRRGRRQLGPAPLVLGSVTFRDGRLVLETKSRERLERGKTFLSGLLGGLARHRVDSFDTPDTERWAPRSAPVPGDMEVPSEETQELRREFLQGHLWRWIDSEIPALGGVTPRDAVHSRRGREEVTAMLKDQEHMYRQRPGGDRLDFAIIYRELGLPEK